jgi:hypothetical protein
MLTQWHLAQSRGRSTGSRIPRTAQALLPRGSSLLCELTVLTSLVIRQLFGDDKSFPPQQPFGDRVHVLVD